MSDHEPMRQIAEALARIEERLTSLDGIDQRLNGIEERLTAVEREQTRLRVDALERFDRFGHRLGNLSDDVTVVAGAVRRIDLALSGFGETFDAFRNMIRRLNDRMERLEDRKPPEAA
jgi:predicted nuclease with TOPRIM domain